MHCTHIVIYLRTFVFGDENKDIVNRKYTFENTEIGNDITTRNSERKDI